MIARGTDRPLLSAIIYDACKTGRAAKLQDEVGELKQKNKDPQDEGVPGKGKLIPKSGK